MAFVEGFSLKRPFSPFSRGKNRISQGVENRGSLISVPLALRVENALLTQKVSFMSTSGRMDDQKSHKSTQKKLEC